ncbi:MAG: hypothetical protein ACXWMN_05440 [Candidatus Limnocylindria bacterium]
MSPLARRIAAFSVLLLSLAIIAVLGLRAIGVQVGFTPVSPTPLPSATPTPSGPAPSQDLLTAFAQIEEQVRQLRRLPAAQIGPPEILTRAELAQVLPGLLEPALDNATLRALGLLDANQDIVALTKQLYLAQVLGYYDFDAKRMVIVSDAGLTPEAEITYAHEYTHALQDASFDSSAQQKAVAGQRDRELALLGLEEGDATTAMVLWAIGHLTADELAGISETPLPDMTGIPAWMVRLLEFPYLSGAEFVGQLYASGGWDAVDAAYRDLPTSTEQILHPDAYTSHEMPITVAPLDLASALGAGWGNPTETALGEAWIGIWLEGIGVGSSVADQAAAGWGGDELNVVSKADGSWALGWRIDWDAPADATQFEAAYAGVQARLPFATKLVHVSDRESVVLQASAPDLLDAIAPLAGS